jgi:uncharacterized protein (DUF302 family)
MTDTGTRKADYAFHVTLDAPLAEAIAHVTAALKEEGFGVLTTIDVQQTLRDKIQADIEPYTILGACNPKLANRALAADRNIGLLLPCNVIVYEEDGQTTVSIIDPEPMLALANASDEVRAVAADARASLQRVAEALGGVSA